MGAVTRANTAAAKRRDWFVARIPARDKAAGRDRLWQAWRWLLAESNRAGDDGRHDLADRLIELADGLNRAAGS